MSAPKHGKEDPKNDPHVGGNTWAGGTGGRDTAGLGGKGGPYRLDKGHKVHQVKIKLLAAFIGYSNSIILDHTPFILDVVYQIYCLSDRLV